MKYEKPDGFIEYGMSGCCCRPGQRKGGQHTNSGTSWYRVNDGEWKDVLHGSTFRCLAGAAETCAEFEEAMEQIRRKYVDHP